MNIKNQNKLKTLLEFRNTTPVVYAPKPPKHRKHPPRRRENSSGALEYLKQLLVGIANMEVAARDKPNEKVNGKIVGMYAGDINKNDSGTLLT
jgi:hypothetical protein